MKVENLRDYFEFKITMSRQELEDLLLFMDDVKPGDWINSSTNKEFETPFIRAQSVYIDLYNFLSEELGE